MTTLEKSVGEVLSRFPQYQNAYHKTSRMGSWLEVHGTRVRVQNIELPKLGMPVEFYTCDASTVSEWGPAEFKVLTLRMGINDRDTGLPYSPALGLGSSVILPYNYTPEQLVHRAMYLVRGAFDHEWREHFIANGKRILDPHSRAVELKL